MALNPTAMKINRTTTLMLTKVAFTRADADTPRISTQVITPTASRCPPGYKHPPLTTST